MNRILKGTVLLLLVLVCGTSMVLAQAPAPQDPNAPATPPSATPTPVTLIVTVTEPTPNEFDVTWKNPSTDALGRQIVTFLVPAGYDVVNAAGGTYDANTRLITWVLAEVAGSATGTFKVILSPIEVLPTTGQSILWIVIIGAVVLMAGLLLFLRTRKGTSNS